MKFLFVVSAVIAVAVAGPTQRGLVVPVAAGPAVAPDPSTQVEDIAEAVDLWPVAIGPAIIDAYEPVAIGPAIIDSYEPVAIGPAIIDTYEPVAIGPAIIDSYEPVAIGPAIIDTYEPVAIGPAIIDSYEPVAIGPAIIDTYEPVAIGPAIIDIPLTETGEVIATPAETPVAVSPVVDAPAASSSAPLVQIILNINQAQSAVEAVAVARPEPVVVPVRPEPVVVPEPVVIVDNWPTVDPVGVVEVSPVQVVDVEPVAIEPVIVGTPIIPAPAVILPDELN